MKKIAFILALLAVTWIVYNPGMTWAQSGQGTALVTRPLDDGNAITLKTLADSIKARLKAIRPEVVKREWALYRKRREELNLIRSPQNPETDLEYMLRTFW